MDTTQATKEFRDAVERAKKRLGVSIKNAWYRGQTHSWPLTCAFSRFLSEISVKPNGLTDPREEDFFSEFVFRNDEYNLKNHSSWEILSVMQHYGIPTRLIDWTENFYVALYFALEKHIAGTADPSHTPCIYVINPYRLSQITIESSFENPFSTKPQDPAKVWDVSLNPILDYYENILHKRKWFFRTPLPIFSPWRNPRISAQRGFSVIVGHDTAPLETQELLKDEVRRIEIPPESIPGLLTWLADAGLNRFTLFRDHESLARFLRIKYANRKKPVV